MSAVASANSAERATTERGIDGLPAVCGYARRCRGGGKVVRERAGAKGERVLGSGARRCSSSVVTRSVRSVRKRKARRRVTGRALVREPGALLIEVERSAPRAGGEGGIRTLDTLAGITVFETARFSRSRTSPRAFL